MSGPIGAALVPLAVLAALAAAALVLLEHDERPTRFETLLPLAPLAVLGGLLVFSPRASAGVGVLTPALVVALLARWRRDALQTECALKLLWTSGVAVAISWAGVQLLALATATPVTGERWTVLALGLGSRLLWSDALALALVAGVVLLGTAPFHFWVADLFHGARAWVAPMAVATLQAAGLVWLARETAGIAAFEDGHRFASDALSIAAGTSLVAGALTLLWQKRPERRVGTLASLQGALALTWFASGSLGEEPASLAPFLGTWSAHAVLALSGAGLLARHLPVTARPSDPPPVLFRRHPVAGVSGLYALASLAGVPGTPGAFLWLEAGREAAAANHGWLVLGVAIAWLAATGVAVQLAREAFGVAVRTPPPASAVPVRLRAALGVSGAGLLALVAARVVLRG